MAPRRVRVEPARPPVQDRHRRRARADPQRTLASQRVALVRLGRHDVKAELAELAAERANVFEVAGAGERVDGGEAAGPVLGEGPLDNGVGVMRTIDPRGDRPAISGAHWMDDPTVLQEGPPTLTRSPRLRR